MDIHPDDILLFKEVTDAMRVVAKKYDLPLRSITGLPLAPYEMFNRMGDCSHSGDIRLVLRCCENGAWCDEPMSPSEVWDTASHELAHLRHMNHGLEFQDFCEELQTAMDNRKVDHKQKVIERLIKMQASRQGEAELGNEEAAQSFATAINRMMIDYELNPSDLDYARATDNDPIIELPVNFGMYKMEETKVRVAWQESLAQSIATAHLCKIFVRPNSNSIWFVGTKSHATVAEYVYGTMIPAVAFMSKRAETAYWKETGCGRGRDNKALGYRAAWIDAFIRRIWERFAETRKASVEAAAERAKAEGVYPQSTGLMRLDGALAKVQKYIDDRFAHSKAARHVGSLNHRSRNHEAGRAAGRDAANKITLGQRGVGSGSSSDRKRLG